MIHIRLIARKNRITPQGYPVMLYININGKRLTFYTDVYINNVSYLINNRVSKKDSLYKDKNKKLLKIISDTNLIVLENPDFSTVRENILASVNRIVKKEKKLVDYMEDFMKLKKGRTSKLYQSTINKINEFDANADINDISRKWLTEFEKFCSQNMKVNGYGVYMRNIRATFNYLLQEGIITSYPFKAFSIKKEETVHRALSIEELRTLKDYDCLPFIKKYRDIFMLMIYLIGINPKDLLMLPKDSSEGGRIAYHRFKTNKLYGIRVEPEAEEIINRYAGKKYLLDVMDTTKDYLSFVRAMRNNLKKIGPYEMVYDAPGKRRNKREIHPLFPGISAYWARHTWASIAFEAGISKDVISLALGHSNGVKVTDIYIKYDWIKVDEANRKVIDYINEK